MSQLLSISAYHAIQMCCHAYVLCLQMSLQGVYVRVVAMTHITPWRLSNSCSLAAQLTWGTGMHALNTTMCAICSIVSSL